MKKHNFSAGPSILPQEVFLQTSKAVLNYEDIGLSILEMSHRDKRFIEIMNRARLLALELSGLQGKGYQALFLQGGASLQFLMVAYNLLERKAAYLDTGSWASKAIKEAKYMGGEVVVVDSSKDKNYNYIPKEYNIPKDIDYLHLTTNNTIFGTQIRNLPSTDATLVSDMSSDIFSCVRDFSRFGLFYAGAQKNIGPAGTTLVVVREDILGAVTRCIPSMLNYQTHIHSESMFHTPSVFAVYTTMLTLEWIKNKGGVSVIEEDNKNKAKMLYDEIDRNPLLTPFANKEDRSMTNVTFNLSNDKYKKSLDELCAKANIYNIKGHRSVGGYRASIYNAMPMESVQILVEVMQEFEQINKK